MNSLSRFVCAVTLLLPALALHTTLAAEPAATTNAAPSVIGQLTVAEVKALIDRKEAIHVFDANERKTYITAHVPGAQWSAALGIFFFE
jgi:hypothetical protein